MNAGKKKEKMSSYLEFTREQWRNFRGEDPLSLSEKDVQELQGHSGEVSLLEIEEVYLPLSRLLNFYITATQSLHQASGRFLGSTEPKVPYIIGVAGSVAVGKSTTSRVLRALLSRWPSHPRVDIITTDGFLFPNAELEKRGLMKRKGFPESYNLARLLKVLYALKAGEKRISIPIYSHHSYDIIPGEEVMITQPDIVILEGLNILQTGSTGTQASQLFVSDFIDFSCFVTADASIIKEWYISRVLKFCNGPFKKSGNFFNFLTQLTPEEIVKFAERIWREINELNLLENILPYKDRANLILEKVQDHRVQKIFLRKL